MRAKTEAIEEEKIYQIWKLKGSQVGAIYKEAMVKST